MTDLSSDNEALVAKLEELKTAVDEEDFGVALPLCEELLKIQDEDSSTLKTVVREIYAKALLHEKQYDQVANLAGADGSLRAYALYRLEQYDKALQLAQTQEEKHVEAQALFHLNQTANALQVYQQLMEEGKEEEEELCTNAMAVLTANATPYDAYDLTPSIRSQALELAQETEGYDLAFNIASRDLLSADTTASRQEALHLLQQAQRACQESTIDELQPIQLNLQWGKTFWGEEVTSGSTTAKDSKLNSLIQTQINPILLQDSAGTKATEKAIQTLQILLLPGGKMKLSALQKRLCRYNMAVLQLRLSKYEACRTTLEALNQSLQAPKKKKAKTHPVVPTPSDLDTLWWQVRVDVMQAYSYYLQEDEQVQKSLQEVLIKLQNRLDKVNSVSTNDSTVQMRDHIQFYLQLHMQQLTSEEFMADQFQWLQKYDDDKTFPAITATLAKGLQDRNQPEKAKELLLSGSSAGDGSRILAEMAMAQENYPEAVTLLDQALSKDRNNHGLRARLVEALSHVDPKRAMTEWKIVEDSVDDDTFEEEEDEADGEALELRELPRIKHADSGVNALVRTSSAKGPTKNQKSQESVLRRRAQQREAHLEKLQQKGLYNPSRPTQPDPERWIPKHERQRRRRRGNQSKASQGGVSAKDAAKLDVMARNQAGADASGGPSTAHLTVAGGSRKGRGRR